MMDRRFFLKSTTGLAASLALAPADFLAARTLKSVGVQLYTLRELLHQDLQGTIKQLGTIGYKMVEGYPSDKGLFFGKSGAEFKKMLADNGMRMVSQHVSGGWDEQRKGKSDALTMLNKFEELCGKVKETGAEFIVVPYIPKEDRTDLDSYQRIAEQLSQAAITAEKSGLQFAYHNHDFELMNLEGEIPYEVMLRNTDPNVNFEMDLYWVSKAGKTPESFIKKYPGRFPLWHVKDMGAETKQTVEVGSGTINFAEIFKLADSSGLKYPLVEQDKCEGSPLAAVGKSFDYLTKKFNF